MNPIIILAAAVILVIAPPAWADEHSSEAKKGSVRVEDLPKPIPELVQQIQQLSRKIEPEISRLGSTLGQELKVAVKKLCEELQCQERPESKER